MDPLFPPRPLPAWQSFFARPLAAAMVLIGWLLRVVGVALGAAVLVVGIYMLWRVGRDWLLRHGVLVPAGTVPSAWAAHPTGAYRRAES